MEPKHEAGPERYRTLPPRVAPEDTVEEVPTATAPAPETGDPFELDFIARQRP